jgi:hypothetical protein
MIMSKNIKSTDKTLSDNMINLLRPVLIEMHTGKHP